MKTKGYLATILLLLLSVALLASPAMAQSIEELQPGVQAQGMSIAVPTTELSVLHTTQYRVVVPEGITEMSIGLSYQQVPQKTGGAGAATLDLDLLVRKTSQVTLVDYDYISDEVTTPETLVINQQSTPPLSPGAYFIGIESYASEPLSYTLLVTLAGVQITPTGTVEATPTPTVEITPTPTATYTPTPTPTDEREKLTILFPPAVQDGVPLQPVRSVQSLAMGNIGQMIPLAFAMQTPPTRRSLESGHDVYVPGTDYHFFSLTWQGSDLVPGIPAGLILGDPEIGMPPPVNTPLPTPTAQPTVIETGQGESEAVFGTYPDSRGIPAEPINPATGVFGALIFPDRYGTNYDSAVGNVVDRWLIPPRIELLPGLVGDEYDRLSTGAYTFGAFSAPFSVADITFNGTRDFVVDNTMPSVVNAYLDGIPVLPDGSADFFFVRGSDAGAASVVIRWDGAPGHTMRVGHRDDIDVDRQDTIAQSTIPSVNRPVTFPPRNTALDQEIVLSYNSPSVIPTGRYFHDFVPVDVAVSGSVTSGGTLVVDDLGNIGKDVAINLDVDNLPPVFPSVDLFNVTIGTDRAISSGQTVRLTAVIREDDISEGVPGAGIDVDTITGNFTEFGKGGALTPTSVTVNSTNRYGQPSQVTAVWTVPEVAVADSYNVSATATACDLVGNCASAGDSIIGDNTRPAVENVVILNFDATPLDLDDVVTTATGHYLLKDLLDYKWRSDCVRAGNAVAVIASVSDALAGVVMDGITADLTEITGNAGDTDVPPNVFVDGVAVWLTTCGNTTGKGTEVLGVVPPPIIINVDIKAYDIIDNQAGFVNTDADQGLAFYDNGQFPPGGVGIELDNTAPTVSNVILLADNDPMQFIANGQPFSVTATFTDRCMVDTGRTWLDLSELNDPSVDATRVPPTFIIQSATNPRPNTQVTMVWVMDATRFMNVTNNADVTMDVFIDVIPTDTLGNTKVYENVASIRLDNQPPVVTNAMIINQTDGNRTDCISDGKTARIEVDITDGALGSGVTLDLITANLSRLRAPVGNQQWLAVPPDTFAGGKAVWTFPLATNVLVPTYRNFDVTVYDRVDNRRDVINADPDGILVDNQAPAITNVVITNETLGTESWIRLMQTAVVTANVTDASGCGIESISADLSQISGNAGDTAVAPEGFTAGVARWTVIVGNTAAAPTNVNVAVTAVDEMGNTSAAIGDPNGILLDNEKPTIGNVLVKNLTRDREDWATEGDSVRVTATIGDGDGSGIAPATVHADVTELGGSADMAPTSFIGGVATWNLTVQSAASGLITVTVSASDKVGNSNAATDTIALDSDGPAITNAVITNQTRGITTEIRRTELARITATIADAGIGLDVSSIRANLFELTGLPQDATRAPTSFDAGTGIATWDVTVLNAQPGPMTVNVDIWAEDVLDNVTLVVDADPDGISLNNQKTGLDLNGDGVSDYLDMLILAENWGLATGAGSSDPDAAVLAPGNPVADMNMDGVVNDTDLMIFMNGI